MAKPRKRKRKPNATAQIQPAHSHMADSQTSERSTKQRNRFLDSLRGIAILLMVIDHIAGILLDQQIDDSPIRMVTRLSMPLFCVLMGYFLKPNHMFVKSRLLQIAAAAIAVNLVFWPYYHVVEILASLLIAYLASRVAGRFFPLFVACLLLYPIDPLRPWFDYPPSIVVSFVAQGMLLRQHGLKLAGPSALVLSSGAIWIHLLEPTSVNHMLCYFVLPATLLVSAGKRGETVCIPGLNWLGRYPLTAYVVQYYIIMALAYLSGRD